MSTQTEPMAISEAERGHSGSHAGDGRGRDPVPSSFIATDKAASVGGLG